MSSDEQQPIVVLVGVGGATCSGKTTLAKQLRKILPDSIIIHQDDFAPPQDQLPIHPVYGVQDWDDPSGAIDWPRFASFLHTVKRNGGVIPDEHKSHDHMNIQREVAFGNNTIYQWHERFQKLKRRVKWVLVDGFLLYWQKNAVDALDVRFLLRVPREVLIERRIARQGYFTAEQSTAAEGEMWVDPPYYFDGIVYPAYVKAYAHLFVDGDVEKGALRSPLEDSKDVELQGAPTKDLVLYDALEMQPDDLLNRACEVLLQFAEKSQ